MKEMRSEPVELTFEISAEHATALQDLIQRTQWVELPFREAAPLLEAEWINHQKKDPAPKLFGRNLFFTPSLIVQSTDERRWDMPFTRILGILMSLEHQRDINERGESWFNSTVQNLFEVMKELPPEHDLPFLNLLWAMNPGVEDLIGTFARKGADATHRNNRKRKAEAQAEWQASGCGAIADFARRRHDAYYVTERTLASWISEHKKKLK